MWDCAFRAVPLFSYWFRVARSLEVGLFDTVTINFLRVGHTHEDIDQFFSLVVSLILKCNNFQCPSELIAFLEKELQPKFHTRKEFIHSEVFTGIYDWSSWLSTLNRNLSGCFANRDKREAPHSFTFKLGQALRPQECEWFKSQGQGGKGAHPERPGKGDEFNILRL